MGMNTINRVVEFKADRWDALTPYLQIGDVVRGIVTGFTPGDDSKTIVTAVVGSRFYKFYKYEDSLTVVGRG